MQVVDITSCGNFAVIGSSCGRVDVFNLQSGLHRGCYGDDGIGKVAMATTVWVRLLQPSHVTPLRFLFLSPAHRGVVRGVATDTLNQLTLSAASDSLLKFWRFKTRKQEVELKLPAAPASMMLHRDR